MRNNRQIQGILPDDALVDWFCFQVEATEQSISEAAERIMAVKLRRDRRAFDDLYRHCGTKFLSFLLWRGLEDATAEEVIHDIFADIWLRADEFDPAKETAAHWMYSVLRDHTLVALYEQKWRSAMAAEPRQIGVEHVSPDEVILLREKRTLLRRVIASLPKADVDLLRLRFAGDLSATAAARLTKIPVGTIKTKMRRTIATLRASVA